MKFNPSNNKRMPPTAADSRFRFSFCVFRSYRVPSPIRPCFIAVSFFGFRLIGPTRGVAVRGSKLLQFSLLRDFWINERKLADLVESGLSKPLPSDFAGPTLALRQGTIR